MSAAPGRGGRPHVLFVNEHADFVGGAERYVAETARLLSERGCRVSLLYGVPGWTEPRFTGVFEAAFPMAAIEAQVRALDPDVVYVHRLAEDSDAPRFGASGAPVVRFIHDHALFCLREHKYTALGLHPCTRTTGLGCYACPGFLARGAQGLELRTLGALERRQEAQKGLAAIVTGSRYMRDHVLAHGFAPDRVHAIPLFVRPNEAGTPSAVERDPNAILFAGALLRGKGVDTLLEAMALLPSAMRLTLAGTGRQGDLFREQAERLGIENRVQFVGRVAAKDLTALMTRAGCVVVPSRTPETFGLSGPEAMLTGAPVVATRVGGTGEWLRDGETGLAVEANDATALAAAIRVLHDDRELAARLGEAGRAFCLNELAPDRHAAALLGLFSRLEAPRARRAA